MRRRTVRGGGDGTGHSRLELSTELDVEPIAYVRSTDGCLADIHEGAVEETRGSVRYRVPIFNPASILGSRSRLRLIHPGDDSARVVISALDDLGEHSPGGDLMPHPARACTAETAATPPDTRGRLR